MSNRLKPATKMMVLRMLCEGSSIRSVSRMTGVHGYTIGKLILGIGECCRNMMDEMFQGLELDHIEVDEMWTFVGKKQARLTAEDKAECGTVGDVYLWTCLDASTKLLVTYAVGKRSADMARRLMVDLAGRLKRPNPHASDAHAYQAGRFTITTRISTDGFAGYPEAVDLAFGPYAEYGVIIKNYRNADLPGSYAPAEMVSTERRIVKGEFDEREICTSHVERNNGTVRHLVKRFTRLTYAFSKKFECLAAAVALFVAYYNFCWRTRYPDKSGQPGRKRPTAAMAAGITDHLWSFEEFFLTVVQYG
jgi:IS1 family transposase